MRVASLLIPLTLVMSLAPASATTFPRPKSLEPNVRFWKSVFTEYSLDQVLVHDAVELDKVYQVLDFRRDRARGVDDAARARLRKRESKRTADEIRAALRRLDASGTEGRTLSKLERRLVMMFSDSKAPGKYATAAERVRTQRGIRERFEEGIHRSRRYLPALEDIFRREGLPVQLTRLPLIESSFNTHAYSKVGAAGMWQFMRSTGRRFMTVGSLVDERLDPEDATRAAARFLRENHRRLGSWPLAITAYNHGPGGMARAVDKLGTRDIGVIVERYDGRSFGFASRNFYAEFLAAMDVEDEAEKHFGPLPTPSIPESTRVSLDHPVPIAAASKLTGTSSARIAELNPALRPLVTSGRRDIPSGYDLRLPTEGASGFEKRLASYAAERRATQATAGRGSGNSTFAYRVRRGDTLGKLSQKYHVSVSSIRRANGMGRSSLIRIGRTLRIPGRAPAKSYRVRNGDNLTKIARRFGVSLSALRRHNRIGRSSVIRPGQVLRIPSS